MTSPLPLPDWVPWWVHLAILIAILLFGLMFLLMPFAVFGVKGRLELLDARLDEIQGEIRSLSLRLPEPHQDDAINLVSRPRFASSSGSAAPGRYSRPSDFDDYGNQRPPIPPAPQDRGSPPAPSRTEPRLY